MVWNSYATQPAAGVAEVQNSQSQFHVTGTGIIIDGIIIDIDHRYVQSGLTAVYELDRVFLLGAVGQSKGRFGCTRTCKFFPSCKKLEAVTH